MNKGKICPRIKHCLMRILCLVQRGLARPNCQSNWYDHIPQLQPSLKTSGQVGSGTVLFIVADLHYFELWPQPSTKTKSLLLGINGIRSEHGVYAYSPPAYQVVWTNSHSKRRYPRIVPGSLVVQYILFHSWPCATKNVSGGVATDANNSSNCLPFTVGSIGWRARVSVSQGLT